MSHQWDAVMASTCIAPVILACCCFCTCVSHTAMATVFNMNENLWGGLPTESLGQILLNYCKRCQNRFRVGRQLPEHTWGFCQLLQGQEGVLTSSLLDSLILFAGINVFCSKVGSCIGQSWSVQAYNWVSTIKGSKRHGWSPCCLSGLIQILLLDEKQWQCDPIWKGQITNGFKILQILVSANHLNFLRSTCYVAGSDTAGNKRKSMAPEVGWTWTALCRFFISC